MLLLFTITIRHSPRLYCSPGRIRPCNDGYWRKSHSMWRCPSQLIKVPNLAHRWIYVSSTNCKNWRRLSGYLLQSLQLSQRVARFSAHGLGRRDASCHIVPLHYVRNTSRRAITGLPCPSHVRSLKPPARVFTQGCSSLYGRFSWAMLVTGLIEGMCFGILLPCGRDEMFPTWTFATWRIA